MRKLLNNPKIVFPLLLFALVFLLIQYNPGFLTKTLNNLKPKAKDVVSFTVPDTEYLEKSNMYLKKLNARFWMFYDDKDIALDKDPFIDAEQRKEIELLTLELNQKDNQESQTKIKKHIANNIKLDESGFYILYSGDKYREGDMLNGQVIQIISAPLQFSNYKEIDISNFISGLKLEAYSLIEGNESAQINGVYLRIGDIFSDNPILALHKVMIDKIQFIDSKGRVWDLD